MTARGRWLAGPIGAKGSEAGAEGSLNVLVVGGGGREHALVWGIAQSPLCEKVFCAPGNAGIGMEPKTRNVGKADLDPSDHDGVVAFCRSNRIDLCVIGPEAELCAGLADALRASGIRAFGPSKTAAQLEGSKTFMKNLCDKCGIPTAGYETFADAELAKAHLRSRGDDFPVVVKADGLAAGKGVVVAATMAEACDAVDAMLLDKAFGQAGDTLVIEDFLRGEEASFFVIVDAKGNVLPLHSAQDHKAAYDGDKGPNTGGMGAYSPAPVVTPAIEAQVMSEVIRPLVSGLEASGAPFQGVIFAGLMIEDGRAKVLEFNVRFGDPECEVLLYRLRSDLLEILLAACDGTLDAFDGEREVKWAEDAALVVVMAAKGYPGSYQKGTVIGGAEGAAPEGAKVFHANTSLDSANGSVLAAGGRVLAVTAMGKSVGDAQARAYEAVDAIDWPEGFCRRDIGWRAVERERAGTAPAASGDK